MPIDELRKTEREMLKAIDDHWRRNYGPPSLRDLQDALGHNSMSWVKRCVSGLIESGHLREPSTEAGARQIVPHWIADAIKLAAIKISKRKPR